MKEIIEMLHRYADVYRVNIIGMSIVIGIVFFCSIMQGIYYIICGKFKISDALFTLFLGIAFVALASLI